MKNEVELPVINYDFINSKHHVYCYDNGVYYEEFVEENLMNQLYIESLPSPYVIPTLAIKIYHLINHETYKQLTMNFAFYLASKYVTDMSAILGEN